MKKILFSIIVVCALITLTSSQAYAYRADPKIKGPNYSTQRHKSMLKLYEYTTDINKMKTNYAEWKKLMAERPILEKINTLDKFRMFLEMRKLRIEGKYQQANELREKLGLNWERGNRNCKAK